MSCHDAREWLSDLVDDALDAGARAQVDAHLAGCAECRRELDRLRATVSLLRAVERPQAPAGFADRVLEAARPVPWHRGFLDRLAAVRLLRFPVEAAAVVLVASLAVYVFQQTPALKQAARPETSQGRVADDRTSNPIPAGSPAGELTSAPDAGSEQTEAMAREQEKVLRPQHPPRSPTVSPKSAPSAPELLASERAAEMPTTGELGGAARERVSRPEARREPAPPAPGAPSTPQGAPGIPGVAPSEADRRGEAESPRRSPPRDNSSSRDNPGRQSTDQVARVPEAPVPAPELRDRTARGKAEGQAAPHVQLPAPRAPMPSTMRIEPSAHVVGRLTVRDRQAAHRELAELLGRVGGAETARRADAAGEAVDVVVPRAAYPVFTQGLARIGAFIPESEPSELPERVPITLRLAQ